MRNKLLKQQLLSRMELKNDDGDPPVKCDSLGSITGGIESSKSASKGRQRSRRKSIGVSNLRWIFAPCSIYFISVLHEL